MRYGSLKLHFVLMYAVLGVFMPYMPLYARQLGISDAQIGWVFGSWGIAVLISPPLMTHLADRHRCNRLLIGVCYAATAASLIAMLWADGFISFSACYLLHALGFSALIPLTDGLTFAVFHDELRRGEAHEPYHSVRIWGSVGYITGSMASYLVLEQSSATYQSAIEASAWLAAAGVILTTILPRGDGRREESPAVRPTLAALAAMRQPVVAVYILSLFLLFMAIAAYYSFYPRLLEQLGVEREWIGPIVALGVVVEIALMIKSRRILRAVGIRGVMLIGAGCQVARLVLLATMPSVATAVLTQLLHGPTVLMLYLVPPMYLNAKAERAYRNSMQGLYAMLCYGVARVAGATVGGQFAAIELIWVFVYGAVLSGAALAGLWFAFRDDDADLAMHTAAYHERLPSVSGSSTE